MDGNEEVRRERQVKLPSLMIGQLARRTGLSVKTIRWYSDQGLVPPAGRTASGYRLFGVEALARLELVRPGNRNRPAGRALLAAPGDHQRLAADPLGHGRALAGGVETTR